MREIELMAEEIHAAILTSKTRAELAQWFANFTKSSASPMSAEVFTMYTQRLTQLARQELRS